MWFPPSTIDFRFLIFDFLIGIAPLNELRLFLNGLRLVPKTSIGNQKSAIKNFVTRLATLPSARLCWRAMPGESKRAKQRRAIPGRQFRTRPDRAPPRRTESTAWRGLPDKLRQGR